MSEALQPRTFEFRFWRRVDKSGGPDACWPWRGYIGDGGYGVTQDEARHNRKTHKIAWFLTRRLPEEPCVLPANHGACLLHRCDNPPCCNPAHLFLGTRKDNVADMLAKGRHPNWPRGSEHSGAKLTEADVVVIRSLRGSVTRDEIARRFGVARVTINRVLGGRQWRHVP